MFTLAILYFYPSDFITLLYKVIMININILITNNSAIYNVIDKDDSDNETEYSISDDNFEENSLCIWDAINLGVKNGIIQDTNIRIENRSIIININNDAVIFERIYNRDIQKSNKIWLVNCLKEQKKCLNIDIYYEQFWLLKYQNVNIWIEKCYNSSLKMWTRAKKSNLYKDDYSEDILGIYEYYRDILNIKIHQWLIYRKRVSSKNFFHNYDLYEKNICNNIKEWQIEWKKIRKRYRSIYFQYMTESFMKFYRYCPLCNNKLDMLNCKCQNIKCNILKVLFPILKKQWYAFRCLNKSGYKIFSSVVPNPFVNNSNKTQNFLYKSIQDMSIFIIALAGNEYNV